MSEPYERIVNRPVFWTMWVVGTAIMGFGAWGLIAHASKSHPVRWVAWFAGGLIVHDFVIAPVVFAVGSVLRRKVAGSAKALLQGAVAASVILLAISVPAVAGFGRQAGNPSVLPLNYAAGIAVVLVAVWGAALCVFLVSRAARKR